MPGPDAPHVAIGLDSAGDCRETSESRPLRSLASGSGPARACGGWVGGPGLSALDFAVTVPLRQCMCNRDVPVPATSQ